MRRPQVRDTDTPGPPALIAAVVALFQDPLRDAVLRGHPTPRSDLLCIQDHLLTLFSLKRGTRDYVTTLVVHFPLSC